MLTFLSCCAYELSPVIKLFSTSQQYSLIFNLEETKDFEKSNFFINAYLEDHYEKENSCISARLFSFPGRQQCSARPFFILNGRDIFEMVMGSTGATCFLFAKCPRLHLHQ